MAGCMKSHFLGYTAGMEISFKIGVHFMIREVVFEQIAKTYSKIGSGVRFPFSIFKLEIAVKKVVSKLVSQEKIHY